MKWVKRFQNSVVTVRHNVVTTDIPDKSVDGTGAPTAISVEG